MAAPILLVGGTGVLGAAVARALRERHPELEIVIAGRNVSKAAALAAELGHAKGIEFDIADAARNFPDHEYSAIAVLVKDYRMALTDFAERNASPTISLSSAAFEIGPELFHGLRAARTAPIVIASHWLAGGPLITALDLASRFERVDEIDMGLVIDRSGVPSGPATTADFERINSSCPSTLVLRDGRYEWVVSDAARASFERENGTIVEGSIAVSCDVMSLAATTRASSVQVIEVFERSLSAERGEKPADEISIRVKGKVRGGACTELRRYLTVPRDPYNLTALTTVLALERMSGLSGTGGPLTPGLHLVETIFDPAWFLGEIRKMGARISGN